MSRISTVLEEIFNAKEADYSDDSEFMGFKEWDSMTHMFLITKVEEVFSIQLDGEEIAKMRTVGDLKNILAKHNITDL